tara:strand:+ start:93 stop:554 length:462 start_codon:yes stop_codon:yes gene_type:complete
MYALLLFFAVMIIFSIRSVVMKLLTKQISVETVIVIVVGINIMLVTLVYLMFFDKKQISEDLKVLMSSPDAPLLWTFLVFAGAVNIGFAYVYYNLISVYKLYHVSLLFSTLPVFILIAGFFFLGETISYTHLIAMFVVVTGLVMLESHKGILT